MKVLQFPLAKITVFFVLGILCSFYARLNPELVFYFLFFAFAFFGLAYYLFQKNQNRKIYFGLSTYVLSFFIGITTQTVHTDYFRQSNYIHQIRDSDKDYLIEMVLREKLKSSAYSQRYIAVVKRINSEKCTGKIIVNLYKSKLDSRFAIGSNIQVMGKIIKNAPPKNPDQFDYSQYLANKSILAQIYVHAADVKISPETDRNIWYYSARLREKIITNLRQSGFKNEELNVVAALILGQQQDISPEILHDYQFAGAIHILSVSGLHIGFILLFVTFMLQPLPKTKWGSFIKLVLILVALWSFAVVAGLSPSVVRSVTMFSFIAVGMHLKRKTNIYHTLLVSLFFILLFEPSFLFDVGFQLSYTALFFILWLQPLLAGMWEPKNKILNYFWDIITVSFAAQIGAFPLSIYYFHQFPGLFFITNLIILPTLGIIMALGVLVMALAAINIVPVFLFKALEWSISILNSVIGWVASFESFIFQEIAFNHYMLVSLYAFIIAAVIWAKRMSYNKMLAALITLILFQTACLSSVWMAQAQREFIVFNVKKNTLVGERNGQKIRLFFKDSIQNSNMLNAYLTANFITHSQQKPLKNLFYFNDQKILVLDSAGVYPKGIKPDIILLTQSPRINLERMLKKLQPKIVVADASNFKTHLKVWEASCIKQKIPFHATAEKGFYKLE